MFFKCSRLLLTSFISLSILFSVMSPAVAGKGPKNGVEGEPKQATRVLRSANKSASKLKTKPAEAPIKTKKENKAPIAAPRTGADSTATSSSFDSDFCDPDSRPDPKTAVSKVDPKPAAAVESRKRSLNSSDKDEGIDNPLTLAQVRYVIQTTDLVTRRLLDFNPALRVCIGDAKSKAHHQAQIDNSRETLISTLLSYTPDQQDVLLDRFIKFTNGWDFLALDDSKAFIKAGIKALSEIGGEDPESTIRHANTLLLTGLIDHSNVSDPLHVFMGKSKDKRWLVASDLLPLLNVSSEAPAQNHEAKLVIRMLRLLPTSAFQKIVQKLKEENLFVRPEVPGYELKFVNKNPKDTETIFQTIFTHVKENMKLYNGPKVNEVGSLFEQIAREERARPRVANQSEQSSQQI